MDCLTAGDPGYASILRGGASMSRLRTGSISWQIHDLLPGLNINNLTWLQIPGFHEPKLGGLEVIVDKSTIRVLIGESAEERNGQS